MWLLRRGPSSRELGADCGELLRGFTEEQSRFLGLLISVAHCVHKPYRPSFLPSFPLPSSLITVESSGDVSEERLLGFASELPGWW